VRTAIDIILKGRKNTIKLLGKKNETGIENNY